jgi:uncharacterized protein (DUF2336 family)
VIDPKQEPSAPVTAELPLNEALQLLEKRVQVTQADLATRTDAGDDVLHYLAEHGAPATRQAVAANPAAPAESNLLLADDIDTDVRSTLAHKIGRLFPGMLVVEKEHLRDLAVKTLEKLAADETARVRAIIADEIKHLDCVPKPIIKKLAYDFETEVASPVVEFSPLLNDDDLIEVVAAAETNAMLESVARRKGLSAKVSDAVVATSDTGAIATLLRNVDAEIRKRTLDKIVSQAAEIAEWQGPLVLRAELSPAAVRRIAAFAGDALLKALASRNNLDHSTMALLEKKLAERRNREIAEDRANEQEAAADVDRAHRAGMLNDAFITNAVAAHRKETIVCALSILAGVDRTVVRMILDSQGAKAITALAWKAGLTMRTAFSLQTSVLKLTGDKLLPAVRGTDFPLTAEEMRFQLNCFGIK